MASPEADVRAVMTDITAYLVDHPRAKDTLEGIRTWWLSDGRRHASDVVLLDALRRLMGAGVISTFPRTAVTEVTRDSRTLYFATAQRDSKE